MYLLMYIYIVCVCVCALFLVSQFFLPTKKQPPTPVHPIPSSLQHHTHQHRNAPTSKAWWFGWSRTDCSWRWWGTSLEAWQWHLPHLCARTVGGGWEMEGFSWRLGGWGEKLFVRCFFWVDFFGLTLTKGVGGSVKSQSLEDAKFDTQTIPGWWFQIFFNVHPENWGFMIQIDFDEHIFQLGWFNHQLELIFPLLETYLLSLPPHLVDARGRKWREPWKKAWLVRVYRWLFYPVILGDYNKLLYLL